MVTKNKKTMNGHAKTEKNPKGAGGPLFPISWEEVQRLARIHCTVDEVVSVLGCGLSTLQHRCKVDQNCTIKEYLDKYAAGGKSSLRRLQWTKAEGREPEYLEDEKGNIIYDLKGKPMLKRHGFAPDTGMQIWLGKQYLGQVEKNEVYTPQGKSPLQTMVLLMPDGTKLTPKDMANERNKPVSA